MKIYLKTIFTAGLLTGLVSLDACKKYETQPLDILTDSIVYDSKDKNGTYLQQRVVSLYLGLPNGFNRIDGLPLDAATDDAVASSYNATIEDLAKSRITANSNPDNNWNDAYNTIRNANNYLANELVVPIDPLTKTFYKAEVRFIRAISYFELIKRYGGVPLIGDKIYDGTEVINIPRNTYDECVQYIVSECDAIAGFLRPNDYSSNGELTGSNIGRISVGAAMALKARVLLYAASPLNNPNNDLTRWANAASAAKAIITGLTNLKLYTVAAGNLPAFANQFVVRGNNYESILGYQTAPNVNLEKANAPIGYVFTNNSRGVVSPTQDLVDAFPALNGRPITDPASGYDPANPYANRDPRLAYTVFLNGDNWLGRPVEAFEGGLDNPTNIKGATRTGYYERKFLGDFANASSYSNQQRSFPIFRYAEVLLNYAEAINEAGTGTNQTEAFNQLAAIRARAGITKGTTAGYQYGLKTTMTQAEMRTAIRNERRIEMAFEEQRFWDIRRWKIADVVGNSTLHGIKITKTGTTTFTYQTVNVDKLNFDPTKNYLYAIPLNEITSNPALRNQQNPGY
ncbi:RagB/SusD family nutrient uptake outer membrane protein [Pedobacter sp. SD-b]|uniref:RagB/SusD family nutrient uptake outer membrane protein n=1 Tax=Pedobacter segetis TaxID=2793069 RepID=A0ABS1BJK7_9SPHI|nr:RagB/SusD family nutrient uptake outer membrane protein [Pedobacter segetis]MBK0383073.1 RagB/SusD family nutrient uptake outer membrane protein [Pedobacter segetis]